MNGEELEGRAKAREASLLDLLIQEPSLSRLALSRDHCDNDRALDAAVRWRMALHAQSELPKPSPLAPEQVDKIIDQLLMLRSTLADLAKQQTKEGWTIALQLRVYELRKIPYLKWQQWMEISPADRAKLNHLLLGTRKRPIGEDEFAGKLKQGLWKMTGSIGRYIGENNKF